MPSRASAIAWPVILLLLLGVAGCTALWVLIAMATGKVSSWMAVVAALDAALLLRMARVRPGMLRALSGALTSAAITALSLWIVMAGLLGRMFGLLPWEAALRLGPRHALALVQTTHTPADLAWLAAGVVIAVVLAR